MKLSSWPRHQLRAQSRLKRRSPEVPYRYPPESFVSVHEPALSSITEDKRPAPSHELFVLLADQIAQQAEELFTKTVKALPVVGDPEAVGSSAVRAGHSPARATHGAAPTVSGDVCELTSARNSGGKSADQPGSTVRHASLCTGRALSSARLKTRHKLLREDLKLRDRKPQVELPHGQRLECFEESLLVKDALGRVTEIKSNLGPVISIHYDNEGHPHTFLRTDEKGRLHSVGERSSHGVVVKDPSGKVCACGESISVDPHGTLSVYRFDGQFFSVDLVRGLHIERRCVMSKSGISYMLTAVFASDGFRMMTRFQLSPECDMHGSYSRASMNIESNEKLRFYGRDGSAIQFESEEELKQFAPSKVWPPGSKHIEPHWRGYYQAGTAWESVQEYISNYMATV